MIRPLEQLIQTLELLPEEHQAQLAESLLERARGHLRMLQMIENAKRQYAAGEIHEISEVCRMLDEINIEADE